MAAGNAAASSRPDNEKQPEQRIAMWLCCNASSFVLLGTKARATVILSGQRMPKRSGKSSAARRLRVRNARHGKHLRAFLRSDTADGRQPLAFGQARADLLDDCGAIDPPGLGGGRCSLNRGDAECGKRTLAPREIDGRGGSTSAQEAFK
jgi:hypothetical protein